MNEQLDSKMRETLSALMDNEASELELHRVMRESRTEESINTTWSRYHLAASAMRKELPDDFLDSSAELRAAINVALVNELVPRRRGQLPQILGRIAIAASVAVVAIFGARQYQFFEPSGSASLIAHNEIQKQVQIRTGESEITGPQFQLPSGFEVPQATARTASTTSYSNKAYSQARRIETQQNAPRVETDLQIQAYMQRLMSQQADRNYRPSTSVFLPAGHSSQQALEQ